MIRPQPLPTWPNQTDSALVLSSLHTRLAVPFNDYSANGNNGTASGSPITIAGHGVSLDGTDDKIDYGDIGNIVEVSCIINPSTTTEQIVLIDTGKYISLVAGTVTYTGLTASATYVDGAAGTTMVASKWQHLVCQFTVTDANNFELGTDGANYGDIEVLDLRARSTASTLAEVKTTFDRAVPDSTLVLSMQGDVYDESVYRATFTPQADAICGKHYQFDGTGDYLLRTVADWRSADSAGTIMAWMNLGAIGSVQTILGSADTGTTSYYLELAVYSNNKIAVLQRNNDTADIVYGSTTLIANRWYFAALVSTGTAYALYIDGIAETPTVDSGANAGDWFADTTLRDNITCGGLLRSSLTTAMNGKLSDIRVYSEAKSADWIKTYYERTRGRY